MRILIAHKNAGRFHGGVESHIGRVVDWLEGAGHEVVIFAMREAGDDSDHSGVEAYYPTHVDFRATDLWSRLRALERATLSSQTKAGIESLLDEVRVDAAYVVHVYHQLGTRILDILHSRGIPTVLSLHDYKVGCPNYRFFSERSGKICTRCIDSPRAFTWAPIAERCWSGSRAAGAALVAEAVTTRARGSYAKPDVVVTLNGLQEEAAVLWGVDRERLRRVPHPVQSAARGMRLARDGQVLFVGRLVPEKGVDVLIRAAGLHNLSLTIVGEGRSDEELRALASQVGASVQFVGSAPPAEVAARMASASVLAVPSIWHEVSPLVVYEAMAAGLPVVASRVGGMIDQLGTDRGLLVEPGNPAALGAAIRSLLDDSEAAEALSEAALSFAVANLSEERWKANMSQVFVDAGATRFSA